MTTIEAIKATARKVDTRTIVDCIKLIGGSMSINQDERMARAALIEVYKERDGQAAADRLMDEIGM